jgi:ubiquinone biosynthesis protein UbiJ
MSKFDTMQIVATMMYVTGKADTIKQAVHMAAQIEESVEARCLKDMPKWAKRKLDESNEKVAEVITEDANEEE